VDELIATEPTHPVALSFESETITALGATKFHWIEQLVCPLGIAPPFDELLVNKSCRGC
jgi:hypothetical protein